MVMRGQDRARKGWCANESICCNTFPHKLVVLLVLNIATMISDLFVDVCRI
jgi:hypothetical protein